MTELRIAVAADIHSDESAGHSTHVYAEPPIARPGQHPLADLTELVRANGLEADYLIAAGDIANRANAVGLTYGWRKTHALASSMGATLLGVPGNHDVITHDPSADPRQALKALLPSFPTGDIDCDAQFWGRGWALVEEADHRILILDSTRDFPIHPGDVSRKSVRWKEYAAAIERGGFQSEVQDEIAAALAGLDEKLNIAVLHHHPIEHQNHLWLQDGYGPMRRGSELLELLSTTPSIGRWLIIHGHKHVPQLVSATTTTMNGPVVLCGASVGATLWDPISTVTRNQFHLISVRNEYHGAVPGLAGTIDSYTWGFGVGWQASERDGSGLPASTGFGNSKHPRVLAAEIVHALETHTESFVQFGDLVGLVPELPYVLPTDWRFLEDFLESNGVEFTRNRQNKIVQVSKSGSTT